MNQETIREDIYTLYVHTCLANKKVYVGVTCQDASERWKDGEGYRHNYELYSDIRQYGWEEGFFHQVVRDNLTYEEVKEAEAFFIKMYNSTDPEKGYNRGKGGAGYGKHKERVGIGEKIKLLRKTKGINQEELAAAIGVGRATISNYEIGRRSPMLDDLRRIADYFGVGLEYFSTEEKDIKIELESKLLKFFKDETYTFEEKNELFNEIVKLYSQNVLE